MSTATTPTAALAAAPPATCPGSRRQAKAIKKSADRLGVSITVDDAGRINIDNPHFSIAYGAAIRRYRSAILELLAMPPEAQPPGMTQQPPARFFWIAIAEAVFRLLAADCRALASPPDMLAAAKAELASRELRNKRMMAAHSGQKMPAAPEIVRRNLGPRDLGGVIVEWLLLSRVAADGHLGAGLSHGFVVALKNATSRFPAMIAEASHALRPNVSAAMASPHPLAELMSRLDRPPAAVDSIDELTAAYGQSAVDDALGAGEYLGPCSSRRAASAAIAGQMDGRYRRENFHLWAVELAILAQLLGGNLPSLTGIFQAAGDKADGTTPTPAA